MKALLDLFRVRQWVKNGFVFIPSFFAGNLFEWPVLRTMAFGFLSFSLVASAVYVFNDYRDIEFDKNHPEKKNRPLAAGLVKKSTALVAFALLFVSGISLALYLGSDFFYVLLIYLTLNIFYSMGLKSISILDIMFIAIGFILRVVGGGLLAEVALSEWLMIMVFLLALFIAFAKRLDDLLVYHAHGKKSRMLIEQYNLEFIYSGITMIAGVILVSYIMYTVSEDVITRMHSEHLYITSIFVIAGILRYLQITLVEKNSGSPVKILFTDRFIILSVLGWLMTFFAIIYLRADI